MDGAGPSAFDPAYRRYLITTCQLSCSCCITEGFLAYMGGLTPETIWGQVVVVESEAYGKEWVINPELSQDQPEWP